MRKYFNAGSFILLGGLLFIIFIFILMIDFAKRDSSLVAENYYQREINFSAHQQAVTNFDSIDSLVEFSFDDNSLELRILPKVNQALISGFVYFYCPSDKKKRISSMLLSQMERRYINSLVHLTRFLIC